MRGEFFVESAPYSTYRFGKILWWGENFVKASICVSIHACFGLIPGNA